jgi:ABC-type antimicrobial peptide transport system permease subunit
MVVLGGIVGMIMGFLLGLLITQVLEQFPTIRNSSFDGAFWTDVTLAIVGALVGSAVARRFMHRSTNAS